MPILDESLNEEHESQGLLYLSRAQTGGMSLFGSSIEHSSIIILEIKSAVRNRDLSTERTFAKEKILQAVMSPSQFADAITNLNNGSGTPITLEYVTGDTKSRDKPLPDQTRQKFESDYHNSISALLGELDELLEHPRLSVKTIDKIKGIKGRFKSSIPFIEKQFAEQMNKTVTEAKADIEAFMEVRERSAGIVVLTEAENQKSLEQFNG